MTKVRFLTKEQMLTGDGASKPQLPSLFERAKATIQAMIQQAELRGDQETLAFLLGEGSGPPVGIVGQSEGNNG